MTKPTIAMMNASTINCESSDALGGVIGSALIAETCTYIKSGVFYSYDTNIIKLLVNSIAM